MLGEKNQTGEKKKRIGGRAGFVIGCVVTYFLVAGIVYTAIQMPEAIDKVSSAMKAGSTKLVLYDGPKSLKDATAEDLVRATEVERDFTLKHCVDTQITVNGNDCYVYDTNVNNTHTWKANYLPQQDRTPITYFDFEGVAEISIKVPDIDIQSVTIRPLSYNIKPDIDVENHTVTFRVTNPDAYTIEFNNNVQRAVHVFANPLEEDVPDFEDEDVLYIGPGEWNIENIMLESGQTLYISGGAVVHGIVNANYVNNVTVCGRGIIDGSHLRSWSGRTASIPLKFDGCQYITVEGVMCLNANAWCFQAYDVIGGTVDGLKIITSRPNGDGISLQSCNNVTVENTFVRAWDDALVVKNYDANTAAIHFNNIQVWTDLAQSMEIGYETNKGNKENSTIQDVSFENITILHNFHKPVLSIHNADDAAISDITYKNIVVEEANMGKGDGVQELIDFQIINNGNWSTTKERGTISDVIIDGFKVMYSDNQYMASRIKGYDSEHKVENVTIKGLNITGKDIKSFEEASFVIDDKTTANLEIK